VKLTYLLYFTVIPSSIGLACGNDNSAVGGTSSSGTAAPGVNSPPVCAQPPASQKPAASCDVTIDAPPLVAVQHVPEGTKITYCSNPPSSGPHYPVWGAFKEYDKPIDTPELAPYLVHDLEHGAVVLLYNCDADASGCGDLVGQLRALRDAVPTDPLCSPTTRVRIIIAPSTLIRSKVAATAWGATYQAPCVDTATLSAFITTHYAKSPENLCNDGLSL
jgi:hypothetical protein